MNRRHFLVSSAALMASQSVFEGSPNDTVRVATFGVGGHGKTLGGRGKDHLGGFGRLDNVQIVAIADVDPTHLNYGLDLVEKNPKQGKRPQGYADFRKVLDDKNIDAVSIATPNHWHTLMTIMACQANKDVYVEKPCSHNAFESKQIVAAARKYNRMVQQGSQIRSSEAVQEAVKKMREGVIGDIYLARGLCYKWRDTIGRTPVSSPPDGVDYNLWLGPAAKRDFTMNRFHYNWHWFWDYGNGDLGNQGIHQVDVARWGLGVKYPVKVSAIGGHFMFDDDQETPNTLNVAYEFNENGKHSMMEFEVRHWMTNPEASIGAPRAPGASRPTGDEASDEGAAAPPAAAGGAPPAGRKGGAGGAPPRGPNSDRIGDLFYGSKGYLAVDSYTSYKTWLGRTNDPGPALNKGGDHYLNFVEAVRSRKRETLNAEIEEGAISSMLVHLANISYRVGRTLHFDPATQTIKGDAEASTLMTRKYRAPFIVPEKV
jgi:predicted dehydrogenase